MDCCKITNKNKKCIRKQDGKIFSFPRKYSKEKCLTQPIKGFTMRSSCAPFKYCSKSKVKTSKKKKTNYKTNQKGGNKNQLSLNKKPLKICSKNPMTGWLRNGKCEKYNNDIGLHTVCAEVDEKFLQFSKQQGNDLTTIIKPKDKWCLCEKRWEEAYDAGKAPKVILSATHQKVNPSIVKKIKASLKEKKTIKKNKTTSKTTSKQISKKKNNKKLKKKTKKQFLYNPKHPSKSMDIYNNENPEDTIPIKFTTLQDVKTTIATLEKLYKKGKYNHKRITQVAMIMRVRLKIILDKSKSKNKEQIKKRYKLAKKYSDFLKTRTPLKEQDRKALTFNF